MPEDYLDYVHDIDLSELAPDAGLKAALARSAGPALCLHQWLPPTMPRAFWTGWA